MCESILQPNTFYSDGHKNYIEYHEEGKFLDLILFLQTIKTRNKYIARINCSLHRVIKKLSWYYLKTKLSYRYYRSQLRNGLRTIKLRWYARGKTKLKIYYKKLLTV